MDCEKSDCGARASHVLIKIITLYLNNPENNNPPRINIRCLCSIPPNQKFDISTHIFTLLTQITNKTLQLLAINVLLWIYKSYMAYNVLKWLHTKSQAPWKFYQISPKYLPHTRIVIFQRIRIVNGSAHSKVCYQ